MVRLRVPQSLARHVAALMLGRQRPGNLDVLGNTVIFHDTSGRVVADPRALPDTRDDITRLIDTLATRNGADKASLWKVVNLTAVNLFARVAAGILPFVMAWYFGATVITDALFWVFSAILFLGGAFSNALETVVVPWVSRKELESTGKRWLSSASIGIVLPALAGVGVFVVLNKWLLGSGYLLAAESALLADTYIHQNAFVILFMMLSGLWSGVFLARAKVLSPAVSLSLKWWGTLVVLVILCENGAIGLLGYSFLSGEALRLILLAALIRGELWSSGVSWRRLAAATREMPWREFGFMFLTAVALHINPMVDRFMASWLGAGAISLFEYGWTIYLLPAMIFTSGYLIIAYTSIAQSLARREIPQFRSQVADLNHQTWRYSFFAIVAVGIVAYAMVESGFGLGKLSPTHLAQVGAIAMALTAGLPFALFNVGYSRILIAMNHTSAVLMISTIKIVLNLVGNLLLIGPLGLIGLAASTVIAEAASASMSAWYAYRVMNSLSGTRPRRARYG
ncbi:MAG: polysaccharide biosynthesis C-terminal domain-containing protein [Betaproteobacteria bacterium]|nr:polysaccharide biosynthesis C-terminal domain-containing protein [Betaproteobacteria bacterium]